MTKNKNTLIIVLIIVVVLLLLGGFGSYNMMNSGFMLLNWIVNAVILVLVILGIYWLVRNINFNKRGR